MNPQSIAQASCADDYDPNSMPVDKARAFIHRFLEPVRAAVRVPIRGALGRVLAEDVVSPVDVFTQRESEQPLVTRSKLTRSKAEESAILNSTYSSIP